MGIVEELDKLLEGTDNIKVIQYQTMSGPASMKIRGGVFEVQMGD